MNPMMQQQPMQPPPNAVLAAQPPMQGAVAQQQLMQAIQQRLTPEEFAELDQYITPRFVELAEKLEPGLGQLLAPFVQTDEMEQDATAAMGQMGNNPDMGTGGYGPGEPDADDQQRQPFADVFARS